MRPTLEKDRGYMGDMRRGASLGRPNVDAWSRTSGAAKPEAPRFYLRRIPINSGGYDSGGAYWGLGPRLYWAWALDGAGGDISRYFRAPDRDAAKAIVLAEFPHASFFR
jgi:hypothetical protein